MPLPLGAAHRRADTGCSSCTIRVIMVRGMPRDPRFRLDRHHYSNGAHDDRRRLAR